MDQCSMNNILVKRFQLQKPIVSITETCGLDSKYLWFTTQKAMVPTVENGDE